MLESQLCQVLLIQCHGVGASRLLQFAHAELGGSLKGTLVCDTACRLVCHMSKHPVCSSRARATRQRSHNSQLGCSTSTECICL